VDRICIGAAFCVALFSNYVRTLKPFNPVLGETFELVAKDGSYKSLAEQVSHHPPIGIVETVSKNWTLQQESRIETKLWGNSVDIFSVGENHLKLHATNEDFTWRNPTTCVHNIIIGRMWIERYGTATMKEVNTGLSVDLHFKKAGWFEGIQYAIHGECKDAHGKVRAHLTGKWNKQVSVQKVDEHGKKGDIRVIWEKPTPIHANKWKWSPFLCDITALTDEYRAVLPASDSRLRGDLRALADHNTKLASKEKHIIEERERQKRRAASSQGLQWVPRYFKKEPDAKFGHVWKYVGNYWEEREERLKRGTSQLPDGNATPVTAESGTAVAMS